jgi:NAD(P)H-hydrate epimerase
MSIKVVTSAEMARLDKLSIQEGCSEEKFISEAGRKVAECAMKLGLKRVTLLIGKGNKGADAFAAGAVLLQEGVSVEAIEPFEKGQGSEWNQKFRSRFLAKGGQVSKQLEFQGLIIDGLLGTGFKGKVEGSLARIIEKANESGRPILAIDIPSGLDGTTGEAKGAAIKATQTVTLGFPKMGLFLGEGWNLAGRVRVESFGLPQKFEEMAKAVALIPDETQLKLPPMKRNRHKYQAGYVLGYAGSQLFRGAPKLAGIAALRAGAGIVQLFSNGEVGEVPLELIARKWSAPAWTREMKRSSAVFVGPGLGKETSIGFLKTAVIPCVIDADALSLGAAYPKHSILTPHVGEMLRLLGLKKTPSEKALLELSQEFVDKKKVILILKRAPTFIFSHQSLPIIIPRGDPGMATAGSGDVLTGILAALLAQGMGCFEAARLGAYVHAMAGEMAAEKRTSYGLIASDLIDELGSVFKALLKE